ncbi:SpoIIE family protein phosphatase [Frigidibacter albus]|uniref:Response regulator receiver domain/protein phosphatase 2C domain-containing protein n=1 Tax=Frigidibacter mobilis TaxID=1335048 RepID=A0A159Z8G5_9RHOB|nr:response regulator receiver domain/protein phosphatase 2C domain-containing protein [Frigidibacter mobilis]
MTLPYQTQTTGEGGPGFGAVRRVLVVDDSRMQRRILSVTLARAGYEVVEAASGAEALEIAARLVPDLILSDWMMPGMDGLDFCRALRTQMLGRYVYFILLTSRTEINDVAEGLQSGADDFLTKPVNGQELRARIAAGERILRMERELNEKNRLVSSTLDALQSLYDSLDRDLIEARKLQQSLVRERHRSFGNAEVSLLLRPSGHVGGDLVGFFPINARRVGLFSIDVSGHGITSALMTARLAGLLSGTSPEQNIVLVQSDFGIYEARPPAEVAAHLNRLLLEEIATESYFTLLYADVDLISGRVSMVQAGHPHPVIQRACGRIDQLGAGGLPVGLLAEAEYQGFTARLHPGDRLLLASDGITEAADAEGVQLGEDGLARLMTRNAGRSGPGFLEAMVRDLEAFTGGEFADDVSAVFFEFHGAKENAG